MNASPLYYVLAYYHFCTIKGPHQLVADHKTFFAGRDATSRIYISEEGINGQMSAAKEDAIAYMDWLHRIPEFEKVVFKIHHYHENVFPRLTIKYRKQLAALDRSVDLAKTGEHVSPERWRSMLKEDTQRILIDVRNEYEWHLGRFEGAECPPCNTFREFKEYADTLATQVDPQKTPVMMYCTGGIRCELYSALLKENGFENVYQLDGGIINYGLKEGSSHWLGKLFVFDDRLSIPISDEPTEAITACKHCGHASEAYLNCANMDCNNLFICCTDCAKEFVGCCCRDCQSAPRLRPYHEDTVHKPFRKRHHYKS
jgi:UPF0176 protein